MIANRGRLDLTVVDEQGRESTVSLDLEQVGRVADALPALREWMLHGDDSLKTD